MRIVLDTNILVRAHAKARGPARELLLIIAASPDHKLILSPFLLNETERVLSYARIRSVSRLTDEEARHYGEYLRASQISELVFPGPAPRVVPVDPDDDPVVHTAVAGRADVLCTLNRDFYHASVVEYCRNHGVLIVTDIELLHFLRSDP